MPETTPLIKAALNLRGGAGFDVYIQRVRNCDKSIRYALMVLEFNFFMVSHVLRYSDIKFDN